jgi:hypothetical protein
MNEESPQAGVNEKPDDNDADVQPWWRRSPLLAAGASAVIGAGTLWFGNMLGRVPLDQHATIGYLLMLPMLLIVPAFCAAALRLAWIALRSAPDSQRASVIALGVLGGVLNGLALLRFVQALARIFTP